MRLPVLAAAVAAGSLLLIPDSAQADIHVFNVFLEGSQEVPPSGSAGTGAATVTVDDVTGEVSISGNFQDLTSNVTGAHLHGLAAPGANAGILIALNVTGTTSGTYSGSGTLSSTNLQGLFDELTYLNVHSEDFINGEIRGQVFVPEPAALMLAAGPLALLLRRRKA